MLKIKACSLSLLDGCGCLCCSGGRTCPWGRPPGVTRGRGGTLGPPQSDARVPGSGPPRAPPDPDLRPERSGRSVRLRTGGTLESSALHTPPAHPSDTSIAAKVHLKTVVEHYLNALLEYFPSILKSFCQLVPQVLV